MQVEWASAAALLTHWNLVARACTYVSQSLVVLVEGMERNALRCAVMAWSMIDLITSFGTSTGHSPKEGT